MLIYNYPRPTQRLDNHRDHALFSDCESLRVCSKQSRVAAGLSRSAAHRVETHVRPLSVSTNCWEFPLQVTG